MDGGTQARGREGSGGGGGWLSGRGGSRGGRKVDGRLTLNTPSTRFAKENTAAMAPIARSALVGLRSKSPGHSARYQLAGKSVL